MPHTALSRRRACWCCLLLLLACAAPTMAQAHLRMQKVVRDFVAQSGYQVVGLGSWIEGKTYVPGTSDHDLRLILPPGTKDPGGAWRRARETLVQLVRSEYGNEATRVLERTNLYAPSQMMSAVGNAEEALEVYVKAGQVPNLAYQGAVTTGTPAKYIEGLYGDGATAYTQYYERRAGRLFYRAPGQQVYAGMTDLTHLDDGLARYSLTGSSNTTVQWAEHAMEELHAGRGAKVAKYLERIKVDLTKSGSMSRTDAGQAVAKEIGDLAAQLRQSPMKVSQLQGQVAKALKRASMEAYLLKGYDRLGSLGRALRTALVVAVERGGAVADRLSQVYDELGGDAFGKFAMGLEVCQAVALSSQAAGAGGVGEAFRAAGPALVSIASLPLSVLGELINSIMKEAEAAGYAMVANSQDAWMLMAGIYTGLGRARDEPDARRNWTLDQMVRGWQDERRLGMLVYSQAMRAADRGLGGVTADVDQNAAQAIYDKCWPVIRQAWRAQREALCADLLRLLADLSNTPLLATYSPYPAQPKQVVVVTAKSADPAYGDKLDRCNELLKLLCGRGAVVGETIEWTPQGSPVADRGRQRAFTFASPGSYPVSMRLCLRPVATALQPPNAEQVLAARSVQAGVDIDVEQPRTAGWTYGHSHMPANGWKPLSESAAGERTSFGRELRGLVAANPGAAAYEWVEAQDTTVDGAKYRVRQCLWLYVGPKPWFTVDALSNPSTRETTQRINGEAHKVSWSRDERIRQPRSVAAGQRTPTVGKPADLGSFSWVVRHTVQGLDTSFPFWLCGVLAIEVTPTDPALASFGLLQRITGGPTLELHIGNHFSGATCAKGQ